MNIERELLNFICTEVIQGELTAVDEPLIESGLVDSMGLLMIFGFVDQKYQFDMSAVGGPKDYATVTAMAALIRRIKGEG